MTTHTPPQQQPPALPARRNAQPPATTTTTTQPAFPGAKTPASWLLWFSDQYLGNVDHQHDFVLPIQFDPVRPVAGTSSTTTGNGTEPATTTATTAEATTTTDAAATVDASEPASDERPPSPPPRDLKESVSETVEEQRALSVSHDHSIVIVCKVCRRWFTLATPRSTDTEFSPFSGTCTGSEYPTHHLHADNSNYFKCCGCMYCLTFSMDEPVISAQIYENLKKNRTVVTSFAAAAGAQIQPTVGTTLETVAKYVENALGGCKRKINENNENFKQRVRYDEASIALLNAFKFTHNDDHFFPPDLNPTTTSHLLRGLNELRLILTEIRHKPEGYISHFISATQTLTTLLGNTHKLRPPQTTYTAPIKDIRPIAPSYDVLGVVPEMADEVITWAYRLACKEQPSCIGELLDALTGLAKGRKSLALETEVLTEKSKGLVGEEELREAYDHFGVPVGSGEGRNGGLDDETLLGVFDVKCTDEPGRLKLHRECLQVISRGRKSQRLKRFLETGDRDGGGGTTDRGGCANVGSRGFLGEVSILYVQIEKHTKSLPSSFCTNASSPQLQKACGTEQHWQYVLSQLALAGEARGRGVDEYYFTLRDLRETVLAMDQHVEDETDAEWQPKKIGGQTVDKREVIRAKRFVALLRSLFLELTHTTRKSINPEHELAYMALTSAKEEEENERRREKERQDEETKRQRDATDLPGLIDEEDTAEGKNKEKQPDDDERTLPGSEPDTTDAVPILDPIPMSLSTQPSFLAMEGVEIDLTGDTDGDSPAVPPVPATDESASPTLPPAYDDSGETAPLLPEKGALLDAEIDERVHMKPDDANPHVPPMPISGVYGPHGPPPGWTPASTAGGGTSSSLGQDSTKMLFGRQQDVTECMDNAMYLLQMALKPLSLSDSREQLRDMVKDLFYGEMEQILTYRDLETDRPITTSKIETFGHLIVDAAEGKDLYDGLDEYFFASNVGDFQGGAEAMREVVIKSLPPVLQIQVQRVQFDRTTANVYKSNAFLRFDKSIYLDRYLASNHADLKGRRAEGREWRKEMDAAKARVGQVMTNGRYPMTVPEMLEATIGVLKRGRANPDEPTSEDEEFIRVTRMLEFEAQRLRDMVKGELGREILNAVPYIFMCVCVFVCDQENLYSLRSQLKMQYEDLRDCEYRIHAVFVHQGWIWLFLVWDRPLKVSSYLSTRADLRDQDKRITVIIGYISMILKKNSGGSQRVGGLRRYYRINGKSIFRRLRSGIRLKTTGQHGVSDKGRMTNEEVT
ncbi:hypothetical protein BC938DRAFT_480368 [Jimgerdemannia flammicorona]|uniref:ubiquitinyl hydrolase 1 n=1 Tax=Jimgerdemannia flammicorona TaxID=994334 RepID=A0A433QIR1_9FUNG|nr:hypothetical protein BC938DRAFT_480368 [Jimgerdemannia flammicorona]